MRPDPGIHGKDPAACPGPGGSYPLICHLLDTAVVAQFLWQARVRHRLKTLIESVLPNAEQALMLAAGLHDVGKINPFFQFQERAGADAGFAPLLQETLGLPSTPELLRQAMRVTPQHALRRHEFVSARIVNGAWPDNHDPIHSGTWLGALLGGHHGYWRDTYAQNRVDQSGEKLIGGWTEQHFAHLHLIEEAVGLRVVDLSPLEPTSAASAAFVCLSGLLTLSDWIASDDDQVDAGKQLWAEMTSRGNGPHTSAEAAREWMEQRAASLHPHVASCLGDVPRIGADKFRAAVLGDYPPRPLQLEATELSATDPGLWICMYPTGDGKTEAALLRGGADPDEGLFFGLPTLATTDAMERRLQELGSRLDQSWPLTKAHHFADLMRSSAGVRLGAGCADDPMSDWYSTSMRKIVAPNVVGTVDQALAGALAHKHITFRLFGLANRHVVLDEIHTFDPYQTELLIELLYWWGLTRTRVTLLSATLPAGHMRAMVGAYQAGLTGASLQSDYAVVAEATAVPFPGTVAVGFDGSVTVRTPDRPVRRPPATAVEVKGVATRADRVAAHVDWARAVTASHRDSPVAIVSNTIADCVEVAAALAADPQVSASHEVLCLHSALVSGHRTSVEARLIERAGKAAHTSGITSNGRPLLVVGTQVIQASLDFDVDFLGTDLAPAPDLLQRLGRAWRFEGTLDTPFRGGRLPIGTDRSLRIVAVVDDEGSPNEAGAAPYLTAVLQRTHHALAAETASSPLIDVMAFSQRWVDAAYDADPAALLADGDTAAYAIDEWTKNQRMQGSAELSRAALGRRTTGTPLLVTPGARSKPSWGDLVTLTQRSDDPDAMRTRFIERESISVLLFDSTGESFYFDPLLGVEVQILQTNLADLLTPFSNTELHEVLRNRFQVASRFVGLAREAVAATLAGADWRPKERAMTHLKPLDLRHLPGMVYDPRVGLREQSA